jgi:hypothetical protein
MLLHKEYQKRHDEVVKAIHLHLLRQFEFKNNKKLRLHKVVDEIENNNAIIKVDKIIKTDIIVKHNKPDIFVFNKKEGRITLIEVGVTSQFNLEVVEMEKLRKYEILAKELKQIYKVDVELIPIVCTWDGIITKYGRMYKIN